MVSKIEEQRKMKDARRRALIIDDELDRIYAGAKLFGQDARGILIREREDPLVQKMYLENFVVGKLAFISHSNPVAEAICLSTFLVVIV